MDASVYTWDKPEVGALTVLSVSWMRRYVPTGEEEFSNSVWVLDYAVSPCGRVRAGADATWEDRDAGSLHLYPPRTRYAEAHTTPGWIESIFVLFQADVRWMQSEMSWAGVLRVRDQDGEIGDALREMARAGYEKEAGWWQAQAGLYRVMDRLRGVCVGEAGQYRLGQAGALDESSLAARVQRLFAQYLTEKVTLADFADALHMSPSALSHRYARETGRSPMADYLAFRIDRAKALLLQGARLDAISARTGFHDAFHLSRTFRRLTGMSPRMYRKQMLIG